MPTVISPVFAIARHEWKLIFKEPRFLLPFLITPLLLMGLQAFTVFFEPLASVGETLSLARSLLLMLAVLAPSGAVPLGADSFAGEKERNTLEILMCLPVRMGSLFWGKVLGIYPVPVLVGLAGQSVMALMLVSKGFWQPGFGIDLAKAMLVTPVLGLFLCALSTLLSLISESVRGAAQLTSLVMLGIFFSVTSFSSSLYASNWIYLGFIGTLMAASLGCFLAARYRFPRLV
ncbi:MAG: ABC transporter permease subunit [Fibrobacterota bacterium]|nr:ABC transporter permease subunit [Fibrobacterota bacterium]